MHTRNLMMTLIAGSVTLCAVGCRDDKSADTTTTTSPTPVTVTNAQVANPNAPVDPIAVATNKDRVKQYADEERLTPTKAKLITGYTTAMRESPRGSQIQTVTNAMDVTEVARDKDYVLVLYPDSTDATKQLAGWVYKDSLAAADWPKTAAAPTPEKAKGGPAAAAMECKSGLSHFRTGTDKDFCGTKCVADSDCGTSGGICDGVAYLVNGKGETTNQRFCLGVDTAK